MSVAHPRLGTFSSLQEFYQEPWHAARFLQPEGLATGSLEPLMEACGTEHLSDPVSYSSGAAWRALRSWRAQILFGPNPEAGEAHWSWQGCDSPHPVGLGLI